MIYMRSKVTWTKPDSLRQFSSTVKAVARGFTPVQAKVYRYSELSKEQRQRFISNFEIREWLLRLNSHVTARFNWVDILENKYLFDVFCRSNGLAVPAFYGLFDPQSGFDFHGQPLKSAADFENLLRKIDKSAVVVKSVLGTQGKGVYIFEQIRRGTEGVDLISASGEHQTAAEFARRISSAALTKAHLIQERIRQHPDLDKIFDGSLNSIRIATLRQPNGEPYFWFAGLRTGVKPGPDNISQGGLAIDIDMKTGVLGLGGYNYLPMTEKTKVHPSSGFDFYGMKIPYWDEILKLVEKAARCMPFFVGVGWDVAISETGPLLLEGNDGFGVVLAQIHRPNGLLTDEVMDIIEHYGLKKFKR